MIKLFVFWLVTITVLVAGIILFLHPSEGHIVEVALTTAMFLTQIGAIYYFLSSLKTFKKNLRIAYYLLSTGIFLFAISELQLITSVLFSIDSPQLQIVGVALYLASSFFVYLGIRKFARLLSIHSVFLSIPIALILNLFSSATTFLLFKLIIGDINVAINGGIFGLGAIFFTMAALLSIYLPSALNNIYTGYRNPVRWLSISVITFTFATFHEIIVKLAFPPTFWYISYSISFWPYVLAGFLLLWTSIVFKKQSEVVVNFDHCKSYIDILVTLSRLASSRKAIDSELDVLREITSHISTPEDLTETDKKRIVQLFAKIEQYLINNDPLRKFTQEDLRVNLPADFKNDLEKLEDVSKSNS